MNCHSIREPHKLQKLQKFHKFYNLDIPQLERSLRMMNFDPRLSSPRDPDLYFVLRMSYADSIRPNYGTYD